jgi:hypothetical protein
MKRWWLVVAAALGIASFATPARALEHPTIAVKDELGFSIRLGTGDEPICVMHPPELAGGDACDAPGAVRTREGLPKTLASGPHVVAVAYVEHDEDTAVIVVTRLPSEKARVDDPAKFAQGFRRGAKKTLGPNYLGPADESEVRASTAGALQVLGIDMTVDMAIPGEESLVTMDMESWVVPTSAATYVIQGVARKGSSALGRLVYMMATVQGTPPPAGESAAYQLGKATANAVSTGVVILAVAGAIFAKARKDRLAREAAQAQWQQAQWQQAQWQQAQWQQAQWQQQGQWQQHGQPPPEGGQGPQQ